MNAHAPLISVGMPAYNAETTIRESIDSILAQQGVDLELIISDNASTDGTWQVIDEYRQRDSRIVAFRQKENIGANGNYSAVFRAARGRYFKWASSNDWCAPRLLVDCLAALEERGDAVLAAPLTRLFSATPGEATDYDGDVAFADADPVARFIRVLRELQLNNLVNGVIRADALRRTRLIEHYPGADIVLVAHLALLGPILLVEDRHFYRRMDTATATRLMSVDAVHRHHYPRRTAKALFPSWRLKAGLTRAVLASGLSLSSMMSALAWVARTTYWDNRNLRHDLIEALRFPPRG
jgi:glycosyltransferase involved in cell wall biosynthesis